MKHICAVGNSHLAALMQGWRQISAEHPDFDMTFFGAPGNMMEGIAEADGTLVAGTERLARFIRLTSGKDAIEPAIYDCFIVCGLDFGVFSIRPLYIRYRAETFAHDERTMLSDTCYLRSVAGLLRASRAIEIVRKLRHLTSAPITLIPRPLPSEELRPEKWLNEMTKRDEEEQVMQIFARCCDSVAVSEGIQIVPQPEVTKSAPMRTRASYSRGSVRLSNDLAAVHEEDETKHMNADYGAAMLRSVFAVMRAA